MPSIKIHDRKLPATVHISQTVSFVSINTVQIIPAYCAIWEITIDNPAKRPAKGDTLTASDGTEWCIHKVTTIAHRGIWQCQTYTPITDFLPHETVNIVRASAIITESGVPTITWRCIKSNLSAKLLHKEKLRKERRSQESHPPCGKKTPEPPLAEKELRAYTCEHLSLQKNDMLELPDGRQYKIRRTRNSNQTHGWTELFLKINPNPVVVR